MGRLIGTLAVFICVAGNAQESLPVDLIPPANDVWEIGVAEFDAQQVTQEHAFLRRSIPLAIRELLVPVETHQRDESEISFTRRSLLAGAQQSAKEKLWSMRDERNRAFLNPGTLTLEDMDREIQTQQEVVDQLMLIESTDIAVETTVPIGFRSHGDQELLPSVGGSISDYAELYNADLLVYGSISEIASAILVQINVYRPVDDASWSVKLSGTSESIIGKLESVDPMFRDAVLGRMWADVDLRASVPDAQIYLNGELVGVGRSFKQNLLPESYELVARSAGYEEYRSNITLQPRQLNEISIDLVPLGSESALITTFPSQAMVYLGADYVGTTPFLFTYAGATGRLTFLKDGYHPSSVIFEPSGDITRDLIPRDIDIDMLVRQSRNRFYASFGALVISLPIPFLAWYGSIEQAIAVERTSGTEQQRHLVLQNAMYYTYVGGVVVTGGLLVDSIVQLFRYFEIQDSLGR